MQRISTALIALVSISLTLQASAAIPSSGPAGENPRGLFATYFSNMVSTTCPTGSYITGFSSTPLDYMKPVCAV